jgi:hypothetical protein
VKALGLKGCLTVTVCVATAVIVMRIDLVALCTMAANKQVEVQQNRWAANLASDMVSQVLWQKGPQVVSQASSALLPMLANYR